MNLTETHSDNTTSLHT